MIEMVAQVLLAPELPGELQKIAIAEDEGREVVGRRPSPVEDPKPPAQEVIVLLVPGSSYQAPMSGDRGQASEGQTRTAPSTEPVRTVGDGGAELRDEGHVVIAGQPLISGPQVHSTYRRARPVADLHSEPAPITEEGCHPCTVAEQLPKHKRPSP